MKKRGNLNIWFVLPSKYVIKLLYEQLNNIDGLSKSKLRKIY